MHEATKIPCSKCFAVEGQGCRGNGRYGTLIEYKRNVHPARFVAMRNIESEQRKVAESHARETEKARVAAYRALLRKQERAKLGL